MKQLIAILFLSMYTVSAAGMIMNYHYCSGHLANISLLNFGTGKGCKCDPKSMPKHCCKDVLKYQKNDNHRLAQTVQVTAFLPAVELLSSNSNYILPFLYYGFDANSTTINDLRSSFQPIFLLCSVLRI